MNKSNKGQDDEIKLDEIDAYHIADENMVTSNTGFPVPNEIR